MLDTAPPREQYSDLSVRFVTAVALAAVAILALWVGHGLLALFIGAMTTMMVAELTAITLVDREASRLVRLCLVVCAAYAGTAAALWPVAGIFFIVAGLGLAAYANAELLNRPVVLGFLLICLGTVSLCALRHLPGGFWVVVWVVGCVVACDTGAYFAGRRFGGRKLWPSVSPKKTWSGLIGGFALSVATSIIVALFYGGHLGGMVLLGALIAIVSVGGDLFESAFKRRHNVKDAGAALPGHGGLLDRFDGLIAAVVFVTLVGLFVDLPALLSVAGLQEAGEG